jgi:hypothetical protein
MGADLIIPQHFTTQFDTNWRNLVGQTNERLKSKVQVETGCTGEAKTYNQVGDISSEDVTGDRYKKVVLADLPTAKRWVRPRQLQAVTGESRWDEKGLLPTIAPRGKHTLAHARAYGKDVDDRIIAALGGTAYSGAEGTDANTLPATQKVARDWVLSGSATDSGLSVAKVIQSLQILGTNEAWNEDQMRAGNMLQGVMTTKLEAALRHEASSTSGSRLFSSDFIPPVLDEQGRIKQFLGINWTISNRTALLNSSTVHFAYVWVQDAIQFSVWEDLTTTIDRRPDVSNAIQFLSQYSFGAVRLEEEKVVQIAGVVPTT